MTAEMEEYQTLTRSQKVKRVRPKVLPLLLLSVILPTADVGTDLALITKLYTGLPVCVKTDGVRRVVSEYTNCDKAPGQYCTPEKVSNKTVCGVSQYDCDCSVRGSWQEYEKCKYEVGPDQYCSHETVSNINNTVCRLKNSSDSQYFCRHYKIWSSEWQDYKQCQAQGGDKYCSDPASNHNVCLFSPHAKTASSLLFFFLLNYVMGLLTCIRREGRKLVPLLAALFIVYPQYCK